MSAPPTAELVIRSASRNESSASRAIELVFFVLLPGIFLAIGVFDLAMAGLGDPGGLLVPFGMAGAMIGMGLAETRPVTVALEAGEIVRKDMWSVRRIPFADIERVCGVESQGRLQVAVRSRAGCLLRLYDEFTEGDKARLLELLGAEVAPHGIAVERPPMMPAGIFGFEDTDSIRRAGEDRRRASAWALLLGGFGLLLALFGYLLWWAVVHGEGFLVFFTPIILLIFALLAIGELARRTVFVTSAMLILGGFAIFLAVYPTLAPPFWTGPGPQTTPGPVRALVLFGGIVCFVVVWMIRKDAQRRRAMREAR